MKFRHRVIAAGMLVASLAASQAGAQSCGNNDFQLFSDATAQGLFVAGNSGYRGPIGSGNMSPGTWTLTINDTGWPSSANPRRNWLRSNKYTQYDATNRVFRATFSMTEVTVMLAGPSLTMYGLAQVTLEAPDTNNNAVLDNAEIDGPQTLIASVDASCGSGSPLCGGLGNANGGVNGTSGVNGAQPITGALSTQTCATAVETAPWGQVKQVYRD